MKNKSIFLAVVLAVSLGLAGPASAQSRFGFKLGGGLAYVDGGDINTGLQGYMDYIGDMFEHIFPVDAEGGYEPFHLGMNFDGEIFYQVTPKFAIGLGVGYFSMTQESTLTFSVLSSTLNMLWTPKVAAIPLTLNLHYYVPMGKNLNLVLTAGAGWYFARYDLEESQEGRTDRLETTGGGFGAHGGLGLELAITKNFFLTLDILGRYARVGELTGSWDYEPETEGKVWFFDADMDTLDLGKYSIVVWDEGVPSGEVEITNLRKARLGLSGFSAVIGFLVRI